MNIGNGGKRLRTLGIWAMVGNKEAAGNKDMVERVE